MRTRLLSRTGIAVLVLALVLPAGRAWAANAPTADALALLALTNEARADAGLRPLVWNDGLGDAAYAHSTDMATTPCFQHDSCNGQDWAVRVARYYRSWLTLGENIATSITDPRTLHEGWMASPAHRANILGALFTEFGAGIALGQTNFGKLAYATEDFGDRGVITSASIPTLPAGGVSPRLGLDPTRELFVNFYDPNGGAPQAVRALVGSACVDLENTAGTAANGTYGIDLMFTESGCVPVVFEAIRPDGVRQRWPEGQALLVGVGAGGLACADTTTDLPTQDCGGGTTPTPMPTPTPGGNAGDLSGVRVALKAGKPGADAGTVRLEATLPATTSFDPSSAPVVVEIRPERSTPWSMIVPALCSDEPCLNGNPRGTTFRATLGTASINFVQGKDGSWKLRLSARKQSLGTLAAGPIAVSVSAGRSTFVGAGDGELKQSGLFAG